jgi:hypothetical protein
MKTSMYLLFISLFVSTISRPLLAADCINLSGTYVMKAANCHVEWRQDRRMREISLLPEWMRTRVTATRNFEITINQENCSQLEFVWNKIIPRYVQGEHVDDNVEGIRTVVSLDKASGLNWAKDGTGLEASTAGALGFGNLVALKKQQNWKLSLDEQRHLLVSHEEETVGSVMVQGEVRTRTAPKVIYSCTLERK